MGIELVKINPPTGDVPWIVEVRVDGKLAKKDYETFVPEIERILQKGKIRILLELVDFHGWTAGALWEDTKFAAHHFKDIERIAIVGDKLWEKGMAVFCRPFTTAIVQYFDRDQIEEARKWIWESKKTSPQGVTVH